MSEDAVNPAMLILPVERTAKGHLIVPVGNDLGGITIEERQDPRAEANDGPTYVLIIPIRVLEVSIPEDEEEERRR
jgi:hypothetical protein